MTDRQDQPDPDLEDQLHEREEIIATLCVLVRYAPPVLTAVAAVAAVLTVVGFATGSTDRAAIAVALTIAPCMILSWSVRYFVLALLEHLDLLPPQIKGGRARR